MSVNYMRPGDSLARTTLQDRRIQEELNYCQPSSGGWTSWSPTVSKTGAGTFTVTSAGYYYRLNYPVVEFLVDIHGTVAGVITAVSLTNPTLSSGSIPATNHYTAVILDWAGGFAVGKCLVNNTSIAIQEYTGAAWPAGTCGMFQTIVRAELL